MKLVLLVSLSLLLATAAARAQRPPSENIDASKMPESGPVITGGTGATVGPNSKNQAVNPMPGLPEQELSERPPAKTSSELPAPPIGPEPKAPSTPRR